MEDAEDAVETHAIRDSMMSRRRCDEEVDTGFFSLLDRGNVEDTEIL